MCIIAVKQPGVDLPSEKILKTMFNSNNDGSGFALKRKTGKTILVSKGHMKFEDFMSALEGAKVKTSDVLVMHFRITTAGGTIPRLTHPFIADMNQEVCETISGRTSNLVMFHNGTIDEFKGMYKDRSDSSAFASDVMSEDFIKENIDNFVMRELIEAKLDGTRLAVISPDHHEVFIMGEWSSKTYQQYLWNKDDDSGMIYSNHSWVPKTYESSYGYRGRDYQDWYDGYGTYKSASDAVASTLSSVPTATSRINGKEISLANKLDYTTYYEDKEKAKLEGYETCMQEYILDDVFDLAESEMCSFLLHHNYTATSFYQTVLDGKISWENYIAMHESWVESISEEHETKSSVGLTYKLGVAVGKDGTFEDVNPSNEKK